MLAGNQLTCLPSTMADLHQLRLLRLSANRFETFPEWLWTLPRLSWLALAGNPGLSHTQSLPTIPTLPLGQQLGTGASGTIYRSVYQDRDVAVKVFNGTLTSDGLPQDELQACIAAGQHPHIIDSLAQLQDPPGLVLQLVPDTYHALGKPPSWETCSRDVFARQVTSPVSCARSIASAARHLHGKTVAHGDLYAHNILIDGTHCLLGDFGAATYYGDSDWGPRLEKIEVRAFGYLVDDLLRWAGDEAHAGQEPAVESSQEQPIERGDLLTLERLRNDCLSLDPALRPTFDEIVRRLQ